MQICPPYPTAHQIVHQNRFCSLHKQKQTNSVRRKNTMRQNVLNCLKKSTTKIPSVWGTETVNYEKRVIIISWIKIITVFESFYLGLQKSFIWSFHTKKRNRFPGKDSNTDRPYITVLFTGTVIETFVCLPNPSCIQLQF